MRVSAEDFRKMKAREMEKGLISPAKSSISKLQVNVEARFRPTDARKYAWGQLARIPGGFWSLAFVVGTKRHYVVMVSSREGWQHIKFQRLEVNGILVGWRVAGKLWVQGLPAASPPQVSCPSSTWNLPAWGQEARVGTARPGSWRK